MMQKPFQTEQLLKCTLRGTFKKVLTKGGLTSVLIALLLTIKVYAQPVAINGALSVSGNRILNKNGQAVSFAGNSLFWCNDRWGGEKYYSSDVITWLRNDWNSAIVRVPMGVETNGGYLENKAGNKAKVKTVVDAAIANSMYVIIDWHTHNAEWNTDEAITFFKEMAQTYGDKPNVIYEIYNEPINSSWSGDIKPYAEKVIDAIRSVDPDNLIIVGTRFYSALVNEPADDPILRKNIAYTIHFYAAEHQQAYRDRCQYALNKGIALFATEWGTVFANGDGTVNESETYAWMDFLKRNHISHCNWAINDKSEGASALNSGASTSGNWSASNLTWSGGIVRNILRSYDYGKLKDEVSFSAAPIISNARLTYTFKINYTATQNRDLTVAFLDKKGSVLSTATTQVNGSGIKEMVLTLASQPVPGPDYSYTCAIRPTGGNQSSDLDKKTISNITIVEQEPVALIDAESYAVMHGVETEACEEGGENAGYLDAGDWMSYSNISIPFEGRYTIYYRVAAETDYGVISLEKDAGKTILGTINVPNTGGWQTWKTISHVVDMPAGTYNIGLGIPAGGYNLNLFAIAPEIVVAGTDHGVLNSTGTFQVYPSPARDFIYVTNSSENAASYIQNSLGETLLTARNDKINISTLPAGVYFITIENQTSRFIKE